MSLAHLNNSWGPGSAAPGKISNFYPNLSLKIVFPAIELTEKFYINMNIFSLEN